jgi:uridylate kinase
LRAAEIEADIILMAKKVDGVYDCDPVKFKDAKKFDKLSYIDVINKGLGVMDSTAASLCRDNKIPILVFDLKNPDNIIKAVMGEEIGTVVKED